MEGNGDGLSKSVKMGLKSGDKFEEAGTHQFFTEKNVKVIVKVMDVVKSFKNSSEDF